MAKLKYTTNRIPENYTYWVADVAKLFGISEKTVLRWVKDEGLVHFEYAKKYHFHSSDLLFFIKYKNRKHKIIIPEGMVLCFKCRVARTMRPNTIGYISISSDVQSKYGECIVCGTKCYRYIKTRKNKVILDG